MRLKFTATFYDGSHAILITKLQISISKLGNSLQSLDPTLSKLGKIIIGAGLRRLLLQPYGTFGWLMYQLNYLVQSTYKASYLD